MTITSKHAWEKSFVERMARLSLTLGIIFMLLLLSAFPFKIGGFGEIRPQFLLIAVYYWAIFRPHMLTPTGTFATGLLQDLLSGYPLGMNAAVLVLTQMVMKPQRKFMLGQHFVVIWAAMQLVALSAGMLQWAAFSLFEWHLMSVKSVLTSALMTGMVFPLLVLPLYGLNKAVYRR